LSKESGLPASSIYWHFGSKSGVLGAVMERGARRFFAATEPARFPAPDHPRERLASMLHLSAETIHAQPQFLRLFIILLLGSEGDHAQHDAVAQVRAQGAQLLRQGLQRCYAPWGTDTARQVAEQLGPLALALFDGIFVAGQASQSYDPGLVDRAVGALHALAADIREACS
jgi:AcrR family transcriptional regulator